MERITITLDQLAHDAIQGAPEHAIAEILRDIADRIASGDIDSDGCVVMDHNGNRVGRVDIETADE